VEGRYYVYILKSIKDSSKSYIGFTTDINRRLTEHNNKTQNYSKRYAPWEIKNYITFCDKEKAFKFEKYLKSGSGKAFLNKHF